MNPNHKNIFFSVGEPSGDVHAANLIRLLKQENPNIQCTGYGGPLMESAGAELAMDLTAYAVMGVWPVLKSFHTFYKFYLQADKSFDENRPDAVVLIDYPGFNWYIAKAAKKRNIPVYYFCPPQLWAWGGWRLRKLKRTVDHIFAPLPFEYNWFKERNVSVDYVGHPFYDEVAEHQYDEEFLKRFSNEENVVGILPGSRTREVLGNLEMFLKAAKIVEQKQPNTKFLVACLKEKHAEYAKSMSDQFPNNIEICVGKTPEIMKLSRCCMTVSGSVSLELLNHQIPSAILYRLGAFDAWVYNNFLKKCDYITLVNLLAQYHRKENVDSPLTSDEIYPEYLTSSDEDIPKIAEHITQWLTNEQEYQRTKSQLRVLKEAYAEPGASSTVARHLISRLDLNLPVGSSQKRVA